MEQEPVYFWIWFKHTKTYEGTPKVTIRTELREPQLDDTWKAIGTRQYGYAGAEWWRNGGFRRTRGTFGLRFQIMEPEGLEDHHALVRIRIPELGLQSRDIAVVIGSEWSDTYIFSLLDRAPYVLWGWAIPEGMPPSYIPPSVQTVDEPPWPFNWIKAVVGNVLGAGQIINMGLGALATPFLSLVAALANLPLAFFSLLTSKFNELMTQGSEESLKLADNVLKGTLEGSPENIAALEGTVLGQTAGMISVGSKVQDKLEDLGSGVDPAKAWQTLKDCAKNIIDAGTGMYLQHCAVEGGSLGQFEFVSQLKNMVLCNYAYEEISKARFMMEAQKSIITPAEYYLNTLFQPEIPPYSDLVNMRVKEKISMEDFTLNLKKLGYSPKWSKLIWDAHFLPPNYQQIVRAFYRGAFGYERLLELLERVDLDPEFNAEVFLPLLEEVPPYSELVNERVKEVLTQDEFLRYIQYYGFNPEWAGRIWDAHFTPAGFVDFLTAMRRKKTVEIPLAGKPPMAYTFGEDTARDISVIKDLSILADYDPRYWSFFETRMFNDPTPRMARWAFEVGALTPDQVKDVVHRFGYRPEDEEWFTNMLIGFQERAWVTKYLTACATAYINGAIDAAELKKRVVTVANRNEAVADWIIRIADVRKEVAASPTAGKPKLLGLTDLKKAFLRDKIDEDTLRRELLIRGYDTGDVDVLISLLSDEKIVEEAGGKVVALTMAQLINAWRHAVVSEDYLRTQLQLRGLSQEEVEQLIETKKRQWGMGTQT